MKESDQYNSIDGFVYSPPREEISNKSGVDNILDGLVSGGVGGFATSQILPMEIYQFFDNSSVFFGCLIVGVAIGGLIDYMS